MVSDIKAIKVLESCRTLDQKQVAFDWVVGRWKKGVVNEYVIYDAVKIIREAKRGQNIGKPIRNFEGI